MNYEDKSADYYSSIRTVLIALFDEGKKGLKVLEIGAAYGETLFYLKEKGIAKEAIGIDLFEDKNKENYKKIDHRRMPVSCCVLRQNHACGVLA